MFTGQSKPLTVTVIAACGFIAVMIVSLTALMIEERLPAIEHDIAAFLKPDKTPRTVATPDGVATPHKPFLAYPPSAFLASPVGNQGDWFPQDSYPVEARRAGAEGRVSVRVNVDPTGIPRQCDVVESAGYAALDDITCALVLKNGRFRPARDAADNAVWSTFQVRGVRWQLE